MNNDEHKEAQDPALVEHLERELDAMREMVRREVGARLSAVELDARAGSGSPWGRLWHRRADWIAGLLLLGVLWNGWQLRGLRDVPPSTHVVGQPTTPSAADPSPPVTRPPSDAEANAAAGAASTDALTAPTASPIPMDLSDPYPQWRAYLSEHRARVPAWALAIASTTHKMSDGQRNRFNGYGAEPASMVADHAREFLGGVFEVAVRDASTDTVPGAVDLLFQADEYGAERLRHVADRLAVGDLLADPLDASVIKVRVAIAVAHLERLAAE